MPIFVKSYRKGSSVIKSFYRNEAGGREVKIKKGAASLQHLVARAKHSNAIAAKVARGNKLLIRPTKSSATNVMKLATRKHGRF